MVTLFARLIPTCRSNKAISRALENCDQIRSSTRTVRELYPMVIRDCSGAWLGLALMRLDWNLVNNSEGEKWGGFLNPLINMVLRRMVRATN